MKTSLTASRLSSAIPGCGYTVLLRSNGAGNIDTSIWLSDAEALELASQLRSAVAPEPKPDPDALLEAVEALVSSMVVCHGGKSLCIPTDSVHLSALSKAVQEARGSRRDAGQPENNKVAYTVDDAHQSRSQDDEDRSYLAEKFR